MSLSPGTALSFELLREAPCGLRNTLAKWTVGLIFRASPFANGALDPWTLNEIRCQTRGDLRRALGPCVPGLTETQEEAQRRCEKRLDEVSGRAFAEMDANLRSQGAHPDDVCISLEKFDLTCFFLTTPFGKVLAIFGIGAAAFLSAILVLQFVRAVRGQ